MLDLYQQPPNKYRSIAGPTWDGAFPTPEAMGMQGSPTRNFIKPGSGSFSAGGSPTSINDMVAHRLLAQHSPIQADAMEMWKQQHGITGYSGPSPSSLPGAIQGGGGHPSYGMGGGGGSSGAPIHGYTGSGIPTDLFAQLTGRGATADDYYGMRGAGGGSNPYGGLGGYAGQPNFKSNADDGTLPSGSPGMNPFSSATPISQNTSGMPSASNLAAQQAAAAKNASLGLSNTGQTIPDLGTFSQPSFPLKSPHSLLGTNIPDWDFKADGGPLTVGKPTVVGERGPEMIIPKEEATVIPNHYLPMQYLMQGDILNYIKSLR